LAFDGNFINRCLVDRFRLANGKQFRSLINNHVSHFDKEN